MSAMNSSAPGLGPRPGILERLAYFVGDPGECLGQRALAGRGADLAALEPIEHLLQRDVHALVRAAVGDRKSTRLNSSHSQISYAVFCLKKKKKLQLTSQVHSCVSN